MKKKTPLPSWSLYDSIPNQELCSMIEEGKKVLDVGCATGRVAEKIIKEKKCYVAGIEINKEMARIAKKRCDRVIVGNIEQIKSIDYPKGYFDIIMFADVLEHCRNPQEILNNFKKYLAKDGYLLISIPNVANWEIRLKLLLGKFDYIGGTILDTGHLRFFTLNSIIKMIEDAGYKVSKIKTKNMKLKTLGRTFKSLFAWGFVLKAVK